MGDVVTQATEEPSCESLERIADAHWSGGGAGINFLDIHQHNACNHTLSGTIDIDGRTFGFIIESGDQNGTVVHAWGDPEEVGLYTPPPPAEPRTFIPTNDDLIFERPGLFTAYKEWRRQPWFQEKERGYNYDRHFQPGTVTEKHYREWAATKGLKVGYLSDLPAEARAALEAKGS